MAYLCPDSSELLDSIMPVSELVINPDSISERKKYYLSFAVEFIILYLLENLQVIRILNYIYDYQKNWKEHIYRMSRTRIHKAIMQYQP